MANGDSKITLKLLIDASAQKVMFAESGKDFVDFMCSLFTLPLCSVIKQHLSSEAKAGSMGKLYQSVEKLNEKDFAAIKPAQLQPKISVIDGARPLLLPQPEPTTELKYYLCGNCRKRYSVLRDVRCACGGSTSNALGVIDHSGSSSSVGMGNEKNTVGGFHNGVVNYVITNDLEITPMSAISAISLINCVYSKSDAQLEEKEAIVGIKEGLALLAASLNSDSALTDVFLTKKEEKKSVELHRD